MPTTPDSLIDLRHGLYHVYDLNDRLVLITPDAEEATAMAQRVFSGPPLQFDEDGVR